jgi:integrase
MGVLWGGLEAFSSPCTPMLTEIAIKTAKPRDRTCRLYDEKGMWPEVPLKEARDKCDQARKLVRDGIDPRALKKAQRVAISSKALNGFEVFAKEWFLKYTPTWAESHSKTVLSRLERDIFPWIGQKEIGEIKAPELLDVIRRTEARGVLETAHRELAICGQVFRYGVATGRCERDIAADLRGALPPVKTKHLASVTDPKRVGELLRIMDAYQGGLVVRSALRLAPLLFVRAGELRRMRWDDVDLEKAEWRYLVTKTNTQHIVPLSRQAVEILKELQLLTGNRPEKVWVFPSGRSPLRPMSENGVLAAMRSLGIEKEELCAHGFQSIARTLLDEALGFRIELIELQLAHEVRDVHRRAYNRTQFLEERRAMMQRWADYLDELKGVKA